MDQKDIANAHLLPLNINNDYISDESDSDSNSIDSDLEVDDADKINDDFIRIDLGDNNDSSEDELDNSSITVQNDEITHLVLTPSLPPPPTTTTTTTAVISHHKRRQWTLHEKLKILSELDKGVSLNKLELKHKCTSKMIRALEKNENHLIELVKQKGATAKKRKRIDGAGGK